jgi:hypothetical protein
MRYISTSDLQAAAADTYATDTYGLDLPPLSADEQAYRSSLPAIALFDDRDSLFYGDA